MRRLVIPRTITLLGLTYDVVLDRSLRGRGMDGYYDGPKKIIALAHDLTPERAEDAFIHEVLHALFPEEKHAIVDEATEEIIVEYLDSLILDTMRGLSWREDA